MYFPLLGEWDRDQFLFSVNLHLNVHGGGGKGYVWKALRLGIGALKKKSPYSVMY